MTYTLIQQDDTQSAHIKFNGMFSGHPVIWDTQFFTLKGYITQQKTGNKKLKQFIDVDPISPDMMKLTVVLKIDEINESNIQKMMIMIKQYKNLSPGCHEYG